MKDSFHNTHVILYMATQRKRAVPKITQLRGRGKSHTTTSRVATELVNFTMTLCHPPNTGKQRVGEKSF